MNSKFFPQPRPKILLQANFIKKYILLLSAKDLYKSKISLMRSFFMIFADCSVSATAWLPYKTKTKIIWLVHDQLGWGAVVGHFILTPASLLQGNVRLTISL